MDDEILKEIRELKIIFAKLIGTEDIPLAERFSEETLNRIAKDFHKMSIDRGEWVQESEISRYIKSAPYNAGKFIREQLAFSNCFKRGHYYLYSRKDLVALGAAIAERKIDLKRYQELLMDMAALEKKLSAPKKDKKNGKPFKIPKGIKNITTSEIPKPDPELVRQDLVRLKQEFKAGKFEAYIDVYKGTHAMVKHIYYYQKYLEPGLKRRCNKWCEDFNYANHALKLITGKQEKFIVSDPEQIQL